MSVTYSVQDHVAVLSLDDGKANALGHDTLEGLGNALDQAESDPDAHAVLLVGRPGRFSAGFDLTVMRAGAEQMQALVTGGGRFTARLLLEPLPVVIACTGHALAAGALLLLAADHRIGAAGDFKIGLNEVAIGMPLPTWATELASYRMPNSAVDQIVLGEVNDPQAACRAGFLDRVVDPSDLLAEATAVATRLAGLRSGAVAGTKRRVRAEVARRMLDGIDADVASLTGPT